MFDSVKEYAYSVKEKVKDTVTTYTAKSDIDKILIEATGNENWNIANSKLQTLADACFQHDQCQKILDHLKSKLESPPFEWRRILKSLNAMEYIIKHGPPRLQQDLKYELYRINNLQNFTHMEDGSDKGAAVRKQCHQIIDLLTIQSKYDEERETAKQYREKFYSKPGAYNQGNSGSYSSSGYGGYAPKKDEASTLSMVKDSVGGIVSGAGSYMSSGLNYLGIKKDNNSGNKHGHGSSGGSHMMGFGSDSMPPGSGGGHGYGGSTHYDPPGGQGSDTLSGGYNRKWGSSTTASQGTVPKALYGQNQKYDEWVPKKDTQNDKPTTSTKDDKKHKNKDHRSGKKGKRRSTSSSSSDSSDSDKGKNKHKDKKQKSDKKKQSQDINLLELDAPPKQNTHEFFDFGSTPSSSKNTNTVQSDNLLDLLSEPINKPQTMSTQQTLDNLLNLNSQPQQQQPILGAGVNNFNFGFPQQQQQQQNQPGNFNFPQQNAPNPQQQTLNMLNNLNLGGNSSSVPNVAFNNNNPQQQQQFNMNQQNTNANQMFGASQQQNFNQQQQRPSNPQQYQQQQQTQQQHTKPQGSSNDPWDMGQGLINLKNLNQGINLSELDKELGKTTNQSQQQTFGNSNPVYIKTDINLGGTTGPMGNMSAGMGNMGMGAQQQQQQQNMGMGGGAQPKFIPNIGFGGMGGPQQQQQQQPASTGGFQSGLFAPQMMFNSTGNQSQQPQINNPQQQQQQFGQFIPQNLQQQQQQQPQWNFK